MSEKKFTQEDMNNAKKYYRMEGENRLLKLILEQKLKINLLPKLYNAGDSY